MCHHKAPPLVGLACLSEFSQQRRCCAYGFSVCPSRRLPSLTYQRARPQGFYAAASPPSQRWQDILSQTWRPLQSITHSTPHRSDDAAVSERSTTTTLRFFRGFCPDDVLPAMGSDLPREVPPVPVTLRPGVSHPLDALFPPQPSGPISFRFRLWGFPFEASLLPNCRTPSRTPSPHALSAGHAPFPVHMPDPVLQGIHNSKVPPKALRFRQAPLRLPPWDSSPLRFSHPAAPSFDHRCSDPPMLNY